MPDANLTNEENSLDIKHTTNDYKNNKNDTNNKNINKIKRPNNKKKFNKFTASTTVNY